MAKIPVRFKRVAAAFDEVARARLCESSGSEHSPDNSQTDLSDLVNSFIERDYKLDGKFDEEEISNQEKKERNQSESSSESFLSDSETKDTLRSLFGCDNDDDDANKKNIRDVAEHACNLIGDTSLPGFKRLLMTRLRDRGLDAGLCKSKWEKTGSYPAGTYEYIDVNVSGTRYIVEFFLAGQFEIARPTRRYASFMDVFPQVFVGKLDELKQVVRLMCSALRESMKKADMRVPPWRKNGYMQAKWFGSYKRTTSAVSAKTVIESNETFASKKRPVVGFEASATISYYCRDEFRSKVGLKVGYLAAAFNEGGMQL